MTKWLKISIKQSKRKYLWIIKFSERYIFSVWSSEAGGPSGPLPALRILPPMPPRSYATDTHTHTKRARAHIYIHTHTTVTRSRDSPHFRCPSATSSAVTPFTVFFWSNLARARACVCVCLYIYIYISTCIFWDRTGRNAVTNIIRQSKSRRIRWAGHVARMEEKNVGLQGFGGKAWRKETTPKSKA
jgi:hypothetical protein